VNSFVRREENREKRREAMQRGWFGAYDLALLLGCSKRRALVLLGEGRVPGAERDERGFWRIPVQVSGELMIRSGKRGPKLRVKDKRRRPRRATVWRI
jgi:hypothetical protein